MSPVQIALWTVLGVTLLISVVTDVVSRRIPDWVTWPAIGLSLALRWGLEGVGDLQHGLVSGVVAALGAMALFAVMAWRGRMGWGDVKLMGAVGAVFGYPAVMAALVFTSIVGAVQAVVTLIWQGAVWDTVAGVARRWAARVRLLPKDSEPVAGRHIPYGVAIALGCIWTMWWNQRF